MNADEAARDIEAIDELSRQLRQTGRPHATVTVVRREPPISASVGDRAIVTADGSLHGWIGGVACAQSIATREAIAAIEEGKPSLIGVAPDPDSVDQPGLTSYPMTCHSEGVLELYIEPVTSAPRLVLTGDSPIVTTLDLIAPVVGFDVSIVGSSDLDIEDAIPFADHEAIGRVLEEASCAVIASMGAADEDMLELAVRAECPYIGLVASNDRAEIVTGRVADRMGVDRGTITNAINQPAGIDIGATTPQEIAISILAELVTIRRTSNTLDVTAIQSGDKNSAPESADISVDPVCGMDVELANAAATIDLDGMTYAFCGQGCADAFADDPDRFIDTALGVE